MYTYIYTESPRARRRCCNAAYICNTHARAHTHTHTHTNLESARVGLTVCHVRNRGLVQDVGVVLSVMHRVALGACRVVYVCEHNILLSVHIYHSDCAPGRPKGLAMIEYFRDAYKYSIFVQILYFRTNIFRTWTSDWARHDGIFSRGPRHVVLDLCCVSVCLS